MRAVRRLAASLLTLALGLAAMLLDTGQAAAAQGRALPRPIFVGGQGGVYYRNMVVVLTWHDVEPVGHYDTISVQDFAAQMAALHKDGFHPIRPDLLAGFLAGRERVPDNSVLLTFDNGTEGVWRYAFPLLRRYRFPVLLFPIFDRTDVRAGFLTSAQLKALVRSGLVTLGRHTNAQHQGLASGPHESLPADVARAYNGHSWESWASYDRRVEADARLSQAIIRRYMGRPEPYFSDPFGQYTPRLLHLLAQAGFTEDFTTLGWAVVPGAPSDRLPRINVGTGTSDAATMVGAILTVAKDTAADPGWHPPASYVRVWRN
jgi:biofilm PGA synthesis lipoprotein PgaB